MQKDAAATHHLRKIVVRAPAHAGSRPGKGGYPRSGVTTNKKPAKAGRSSAGERKIDPDLCVGHGLPWSRLLFTQDRINWLLEKPKDRRRSIGIFSRNRRFRREW
jgi:hypothetical protein